jgi:hypothetical protein
MVQWVLFIMDGPNLLVSDQYPNFQIAVSAVSFVNLGKSVYFDCLIWDVKPRFQVFICDFGQVILIQLSHHLNET